MAGIPHFQRLILLAAAAAMPASGAAAKPGDRIPDRYICVFKAGPISAGLEARQAVASAGGALTHVYSHVLNGFAARLPAAALERLRARNPLIDYCEPDRVVGVPPNEAGVTAGRPGGGGGGGSSQSVGWNIKRVGGPGDGTGRTAWIIDTGLDFNHEDLNTDQGRSVSYLGLGTTPADQNGHGTHVGGIIGAKNDAVGVVGVAAGATLVSLRVLDASGYGDDSNVIQAIDDLAGRVGAANGAAVGDVANLSLTADAVSTTLDTAVANLGAAGIKVVIASGNNGQSAGNYSPARAEGTNVYTVAAFGQVGKRDVWASYSNYGQPPVDYAEPGSSIVSTVIDGYGTKSGTSMAAPHLAGILLLGAPVNSGTVARTSSDVYTVGAH